MRSGWMKRKRVADEGQGESRNTWKRRRERET